MALSDWVVNNSSGNFTTSIDVTAPIIGSGSLSMIHDATGGAGTEGATTLYLGAGFTKGFTKGKIRTIIRFDEVANFSGNNLNGGVITCMQSVLDINAAAGDFYALRVGALATGGGAFGDVYLNVERYTAGLSNASPTTTFSSTLLETALTILDHWPVEFEWVSDVPALGGTRLTVRVGTKNSTDFGTLVLSSDVVDSATPLTVSVAEGVGAVRNAQIASQTCNIRVDNTTIFELV